MAGGGEERSMMGKDLFPNAVGDLNGMQDDPVPGLFAKLFPRTPLPSTTPFNFPLNAQSSLQLPSYNAPAPNFSQLMGGQTQPIAGGQTLDALINAYKAKIGGV